MIGNASQGNPVTSKRVKAHSLVGDVSTPKKKGVDGSVDKMVTTFKHYPASLVGVGKRPHLFFFLTPENPLNTVLIIKLPICSEWHSVQLLKPLFFSSFCKLVKNDL